MVVQSVYNPFVFLSIQLQYTYHENTLGGLQWLKKYLQLLSQ